jgi:hypothetical protein
MRAAARTPVKAATPQTVDAPVAGPEALDLVVEMAHDLRSPL